MNKIVLDGNKLYESGKPIGDFHLLEGQHSKRMTLIERFAGSWCDLRAVELTEKDKSLAELAGKIGSGVLLVLEGRFQMADTVNANNRIYPGTLWDKILADTDLQRKVEHGEMLGECDHPRDGETLLSRVACMVTSFGRNPENTKEIVGRLVVFNTEAGRNIKAIHEGGGRIGVSSRGQGSVVRQDGVDIVQDDYELETWDVVHNPSTPGAYPEVRTESKENGTSAESKENVTMGRLQDLADRFDRVKARDINTLSSDAVGIIREQVSEIKDALLKEDFGKDAPKAAMMVTEVALFEQKLSQPKATAPQKEPEMTEEERRLFEAEIPPEKRDPEKWKKAKELGAKGPYTDGKWPKTMGIYKKMVGVESKPASRAKTVEETIAILRSAYTGGTTDMREAMRIAREAYREAVRLEGPLEKHELDGLSKFVTEVIQNASKADRSESFIKATFINGDGSRSTKSYASEEKLQEDLKNTTGATIVEVDRSKQVYEEAARKFEPLLESQTIKAINAVNEVAKVRAGNSALSAKIAAAVQVIEALVARANRAEASLTETRKDLDSAAAIIKALVEETHVEKMRGAIHAIAGTHPHLDGLDEVLARANSITEAIRLTNEKSLESLTEITREPIPGSRKKNVTEALEKSRAAEQALEESAREGFVDHRMKSIADVTDRVVSLMHERDGFSK